MNSLSLKKAFEICTGYCQIKENALCKCNKENLEIYTAY